MDSGADLGRRPRFSRLRIPAVILAASVALPILALGVIFETGHLELRAQASRLTLSR